MAEACRRLILGLPIASVVAVLHVITSQVRLQAKRLVVALGHAFKAIEGLRVALDLHHGHWKKRHSLRLARLKSSAQAKAFKSLPE